MSSSHYKGVFTPSVFCDREKGNVEPTAFSKKIKKPDITRLLRIYKMADREDQPDLLPYGLFVVVEPS